MLNATVQNKAFPLAGLMYANVNVRSAAKFALNAINRDVHESFATSTCAREGEFSESIKKRFYSEFLESIKKSLLTIASPVYGYVAPAKSGAGIGVLELIEATHDAPCVFFCAVSLVHLDFSATGIIRSAHNIMVGWAGASSEAPGSLITGYANPVQSTTLEIGVSGGGYIPSIKEAAKCWLLSLPRNRNSSGLLPLFVVTARLSALPFIASQPQVNRKPAARWPGKMCSSLQAACQHVEVSMHNSAYSPLIPGTDLFGTLDHCEALCAELVECRSRTLHLALSGLLSHSLDVIRSQLDQPLPPHLIQRLTADNLPDSPVPFVPDSDLLCRYCLALVQALLSCALTPDAAQQLSGLLYELVGVLADDLKAPRFVREVAV